MMDTVPEQVVIMAKIDESDLVYKGPFIRTAEQRLFKTLETDYEFPKALCRFLVNFMLYFLNETFNKKLYESQMTFHFIAESRYPGRKVQDLKSKPVHLTNHYKTDIEILIEEGIAGLRQKKIVRITHETLDQGCLLTQYDLAVLLYSSKRTIRRDIVELKKRKVVIPTRGTFQDIRPGITHKSKVVSTPI